MSIESTLWFGTQLGAGALALLLGWRVSYAGPRVWKPVATLAAAIMLLWPLMRVFPISTLDLLGARIVIFIEVTGLFIPAVLFFSIAARHLRHASERRTLRLLLVVCVAYFVHSGLWMVRPPVPDLDRLHYADGICRQSTGYTCVAASLVTMLGAYGIEATETEMARLSYTEVDRGATDSRAVYALEQRLDPHAFDVCYEAMDYDRLLHVGLPCVVPIEWGYFCSHMVPVVAADSDGVTIGDPLTGPRAMKRAAFERVWLGRGIHLLPR